MIAFAVITWLTLSVPVGCLASRLIGAGMVDMKRETPP